MKVAVIGAGVAGLCAARELRSEAHTVVVFEKSDRIGGTWVYDPRVDSDPLSLDPNREIVHGSLYASLRTNLPRPLMGFSDYPLTIKENGDPRYFPGHEEVLRFLNDFARDFGLTRLIRFNTEVVRVEPVGSNGDGWTVQSRTGAGMMSAEEEVFEAVVVCNGHHTEPRLAVIAGIEKWPGKQMHSHNYRVPDPFDDQIVVMIGSGPSAYDISREIASVAKQVHLSSRSPDVKPSKLQSFHNIWQHSMIESVFEDGTVAFQDGSSVHANTIIHCTGYKYNFPFLKVSGIVTVEDNRVGPLYKHIFPPQLSPTLSFIGLPQRVFIFMMMELQSKWVAHVLSGKVTLPSEEEMMEDIKQHYLQMKLSNIPIKFTHTLNPPKCEYIDWLAEQVGVPPPEEKYKKIFAKLIEIYLMGLEGYRDECEAIYFENI